MQQSELEEAKALFEAGRNEEGRLRLLRLLQAEPESVAALMMLSGDYYAAARYADALRVFERLVQLCPDSGVISVGLFNTLMQQGSGDAAVAEVRRFMAVADPQRERETLAQYAQLCLQLAEQKR